MTGQDAIIIALPALGSPADAPAFWWRITEHGIVESGDDVAQWMRDNHRGDAPTWLAIGIAPAVDAVCHRAQFTGLAPRQAEAAARLMAADYSISPADDLHIWLSSPHVDGVQDLVMCAHQAMAHWLEWGAARGFQWSRIIPAGLLLPMPGAQGGFTRAVVGSETVLREADSSFAADPALIDHLVTPGLPITHVSAEQITAALAAACADPAINLRSGRWTAATQGWFTPAWRRRALLLTGATMLVTLLIAAASLTRLYADTNRLDAATQADAARVLGHDVPADQAVGQLDAKLARQGGGPARMMAPLAALVSAMESAPSTAIESLSWHGDGVLTISLGAPRAEDINTVLIALQSAGWTVTAQPRSGTDGRAFGDVTIRSGT